MAARRTNSSFASLPLIRCDASGTAEIVRPFSVAQLHRYRAIKIAFPNGRKEKLQRNPWSTTGLTSIRFSNEHLVLKLVHDEHMARREACILNTLRSSSSVPKLYCAIGNLVLMENVGVPLTISNLPRDYRKQAINLLADFRKNDVRHNDLWKNDTGSPSLFATELLVDGYGRMRAVDFGTASVHGSYQCAPGIRNTALPATYDHKFAPGDDAQILSVLDALSVANLTLRFYQKMGVQRARLGLCRMVTRHRYLMARAPKPRKQRSRRREQDNAACRTGSKHFGEFEVLNGSQSFQTSSTHDRLPSVPNQMPSTDDIRACIAACNECERCHSVSVSSARRMCLWFRPDPSRKGGVCDGISGAGLANETMLRTAWDRKRWPPVTNLSWEHRLDDFVTIDLREYNASIEQEVTDASAEIDGRPPIHVRRPQGFNLEPYGLDRMDNLRMRSILIALEFDGPSVAMLPDGKLLCGVRAANEALAQSRIGTDELLSDGGAGLFMVHSHEQGKDSVALHARMLHLLKKTGSYNMLRHASLLLVNNNVGDIMRKGKSFQPGTWLHAYSRLKLRVRMLIMTKVNLGYHCGEFQAIASAVKILRLFPWVLYSSGPDSLPTSHGLAMLGSIVVQDALARAGSSSRPGIVCEQFPAFPGLLRIRMDHFLFYPDRSESVWPAAAADCFRSGAANPEQLLAYHFRDQNVSMRFLGWNHTHPARTVPQPLGYVSMWSKQHSTKPHDRGLVWHTHNTSAVEQWISALESKTGIVVTTGDDSERHARAQFHYCALHRGQQRLEGGAWTN